MNRKRLKGDLIILAIGAAVFLGIGFFFWATVSGYECDSTWQYLFNRGACTHYPMR